MRVRAFILGLTAVLLWASSANAQGNPTAKLSGRVTSGSQPLQGVKVTVSSPNLQGTRSTSTSANGDYLFPALPAGEYLVTFEMDGLQKVTQEQRLSAAQASVLDTEMAAAAVTEEINVVGELEAISEGTQTATTYTKTLIDQLPAGRALNQIVALSPGVQPNGPSKDATTGLGNITISGAPSYENLFLLNGVVLNENIRGQAFDLFIEDAVQETTTASAGVSAEYGRFSGGVVNVLTKSGGNDFSGSFRTTFNNQKWESKTPLTTTQTDKVVPTYEATLGGPVLRDRLWFFLAGRSLDRSTTQNTSLTNIPFANEREQQRYEGKLTATITPRHTVFGTYSKIDDKEEGNVFGSILDKESLVNRETPQKLWAVNYSGSLSDNLLLTGQYSERQFTFIGAGAPSRDLIEGTLIIARALNGTRYHSPTFCGVCEPEHRDNKNGTVKASYFLSTESLGSHDLVAGYDTFDDIRNVNNHQSGSDYRILGTTAILRGDQIYPVFANDGSTIIQFNPILNISKGTNFRTDSLFVNDTWRFSDRLSFNVGLRYDKNDGEDAEGKKVAKDSNLSPRMAVNFDPKRNGQYMLHASYGKYVAAIANSIGDSSSSAGGAANFQWAYRGPAINTDPNGPLISQDDALRILFDWFNSQGGANGSLPLIAATIPGGNVKIRGSLNSPNVVEYSAGVTARLGAHGIARADVVHRDWADFYASRIDTSTGQVTTSNGRVDLALVENNNSLYERTYDGLHTQFRYQPSDRLDIGGNWTLSRTHGNFDAENQASGPVLGGIGRYPEYLDRSWFSPSGDLAVDQRHRVNLYGLYQILSGRTQTLSVSLLQSFASGHPYGAVGTATLINPATGANYVTNPGYVNPPVRTNYYFTSRDTFKTPNVFRTDLSFNYSFRFSQLELFVHPEVINVFNSQRVDTTAVDVFDTTILTADNRGDCDPGPGVSACKPFNPFTEKPVQGVNWQKGPNFGKPVSPRAYQVPRTYRLSIGLRF
jgi:outer membrane receptor protein involved in Fe transport